MTELVTPHLRTVLKTYQDSAPNSLQGPGSLHHKLEINSTSSNSINLNSSSSSGGGGGGSSNNNGIINTNGTNSSNTTTNNSNSSSGHNNSSSNNNSSSSTNSNNASSIDEDESMYNGDEKHVQKIHLSPPIIVAQPPPLSQPILTTSDSGCGVLKETILEGKRIGCFLLGGEMRLCFPQILNNILNEFTVEQINRIFDELRIFCSQCTQEQLNEFKSAKILPEKVTGSGLITRTNAERLCSALLHRGERNVRITTNGKNASPPITFKVYHRCFGKCEGLLTPDLYSFKEPSCIECLECHGMFSAQKFVCHVHRQVENSVCHWGFDSNMWRAYLHVSPDEDNVDKYTKILDDLREREKQGYSIIMQQQREVAYLKRKAEEQTNLMTPMKLEPLDIPLKKSKIIEEPYKLDPYTYQQILFYQNQLSPFRPWTVHQMHQQQVLAATQQKQHQILGLPYPNGRPYLSQEPPVLQNPERVVRSSESERFERSFQPNVALVPKKSILSKEREREREREKERERERERDRDRDHRERERERERESSVIKCDVQIKQERPSTPSDKSSNSPELRNSPQSYMSSLPAGERSLSPPQTQPLPLLPIEKTSPISPEGQSGSNEITSSTSPVPVQSSQIHPKLLIVSSAGGDTIASPPPPPVRRTPIPTENIHHRSHHHPHSIPTQLLQHHQQLYLQQQQQHSHQTSMMPGLQKSPILKSSLSSLRNGDLTAVVAGVGGRVGDGAVSLTNGTTTIMINPEFELSTDTDDDSLTGEADSSLQNTAYDLAIELLKDTNARNDNRDKLLNIIKYLVQENGRLTQDIIRKDEYIKELLQKHQQLSNHVQATPSPPPSTSPSSSPHIKALPLCEQTSVVVAIPTHNSSNTANHTNNSSSNNCNNNNINSNSNNNNTIVENHNNIDTTIATTIKIERRNSFLETNCTTTNNNINNSNTSSNNNNNHSSSPPPPPVTTRTASPPVVALKKTDIIMKPLKKSLRRSPEDSVVVLNNNHSSSNQSPSHPQQLQSPTSTEKIVSSNNNNNNSSNNNNNIVEKILI